MTSVSVKVNIPLKNKIFLSANRLSVIFLCVIAFLFYPYAQLIVRPWVIAIIVPVSFFAAAALMPLCRFAVNRVRSVILGRYHVSLVISALILSGSTAFLFNVSPDMGEAGAAAVLALLLLLSLIGFMLYQYLCFGLERRLAAQDGLYRKIGRSVTTVAAVASCVLMLLLDLDLTGYSRIGYIAAIVLLFSVVSVYFSTCKLIPRFIHEDLPQKRTIGQIYARYLKIGVPTRLKYLAAFCSFAAAAIIASSLVYTVTTVYALEPYFVAAALGAACLVIAVSYFVGFRRMNPAHIKEYCLAGAIAVTVAAVVLSVEVIATLPEAVSYVLLFLGYVLAGAGFSIFGVIYKRSFLAAPDEKNMTPGIGFIARNAFGLLGLGFGILILAVIGAIAAATGAGALFVMITVIVVAALSSAGVVVAVYFGARTDDA